MTPANHREESIRNRPSPDFNLWMIFGVTLVAVMGVASITPAFPAMIDSLDIQPGAIGWLITVFTVPGVVLTPVLGILADRTGRKRILVPALLLFGFAGAACSLANDFGLLLVLRFFQGAGAASLGSLNVTLIGDLYQGQRRITAMGYNASVLSMGTATYPALGGLLATLGWHFPFLLPLLAIPVGLAVLFFLQNPEPRNRVHLAEYLRQTWRYIRKPRTVAMLLASATTFIILYGTFLTYFPVYVSDRFQGSPLVIGVLMSALSVSTALTASLLGRISRIFPRIVLIRFSFLLFALALVIFVFIPSLWLLLIPGTIFGMAHGVNFPSIQTVMAESAPLEYRGAFMSVYGMVLRMGQTLGPLLMGAAFMAGGIRVVFFAGAGFALLALAGLFLFNLEKEG